MKTLFNSAKNMNKFPHIKCGNQKLNGEYKQSKWHLKILGEKICNLDVLAPK